MRRLFIILSVAMIVNFTISSIASTDDRELAEMSGKSQHVELARKAMREYEKTEREYTESARKAAREYEKTEREYAKSALKTTREYAEMEIGNVLNNDISASKEFKREITREFAVSAAPALSINNEFGVIRIIEGNDDEIVFKITVTGKGKDEDAAKKYAESVNVKFKQNGNSISAETVFGQILCRNNCGRNVDYEVTVPKGTRQTLKNMFGDINVGNTTEPLDVRLEFGKLYANELSEADLDIQHGGATINKCGKLKIKSNFSKYKLGETGSLSGSLSHCGDFDIEELGDADVKSDFSGISIKRLKNSFNASSISFGSLTIDRVDENFSKIKVNANFSAVKVAFTERNNFKATLYSDFGAIKIEDVVFYEKSLDKKEVVVGIAGKIKDPSATVDISNEFGNITLYRAR
jgi:hypothetical protein